MPSLRTSNADKGPNVAPSQGCSTARACRLGDAHQQQALLGVHGGGLCPHGAKGFRIKQLHVAQESAKLRRADGGSGGGGQGSRLRPAAQGQEAAEAFPPSPGQPWCRLP